jgi:amidohydrolase
LGTQLTIGHAEVRPIFETQKHLQFNTNKMAGGSSKRMAGLLGHESPDKQKKHDHRVELSTEALEKMGGSHTSSSSIHVLKEVHELYDEMVTNRRWFHHNPELSFEEYNTAKHIVEILLEYGIPKEDIWTEIGKTGVVAMIYGGAGTGPCIMLRADMDALSVQETADVEYKSQNPNVMHACGHDGHMSALLCAAKILLANKESLRGSIKLCFQPAEEGRNGATAMINDGLLDGKDAGLKCGGPRVDMVFGIHLWSFERLGGVQCSEGPIMAASDKFTIEVNGKGGHGAVPHQANDAIVSAASLITSLQSVVSRNVDPLEASVVTCGTIKGGFGYNIIADKVTITGTARAFSKTTQELVKKRMEEVCCGCSTMYGSTTNFTYEHGYPPTVNAYPECVEMVRNAAKRVVGEQRCGLPQRTMGAEDFSFFLEQRPGCFWFVGAAKRGEVLPHHKSIFDFDERALLISASTFVELVNDILR